MTVVKEVMNKAITSMCVKHGMEGREGNAILTLCSNPRASSRRLVPGLQQNYTINETIHIIPVVGFIAPHTTIILRIYVRRTSPVDRTTAHLVRGKVSAIN